MVIIPFWKKKYMKNKRAFKRKYRVHKTPIVVNKHFDFFFNNDTKHYFLAISNTNKIYDGHDMTSRPKTNKSGKVSSQYFLLKKNPEPQNNLKSYIKRKIRKKVPLKYDNGKRRLRKKYLWKLCKVDKKRIKILDRKYWKKKNTCKHQTKC